MSTTESDRERLARAEDTLVNRCDRAWGLFVLAGASAGAARLEPPLRSFWVLAALIAACGSGLFGTAAAGARDERDAVLDEILIVASRTAREDAVGDRARRIGSPRARAGLARRLDALVARSGRGGRAECFQAGLVRAHAARLRAIAARLRAADAPAPALARLHRLLRDPRQPARGAGCRQPAVRRVAAPDRDRPCHPRTGIITPCLRPTPSST